jgi:hypothetical protein
MTYEQVERLIAAVEALAEQVGLVAERLEPIQSDIAKLATLFRRCTGETVKKGERTIRTHTKAEWPA